MKITLHEPPEGYEAEAEWRKPIGAEPHLDSVTGKLVKAPSECHRIVLTPKRPAYISRPDWLPPRLTHGWLAMDPNGDWYWFETGPHMDKGQWVGDGEGMCRCLPPCLIPEGYLTPEDWRESLICCTPEGSK